MKRFAINTFAVLYAVLMISVSLERSNAWAAREAVAVGQPHSGRHPHGFGKTEKSVTHLSQTKLVETEFVVELPREAAAVPLHSERLTMYSASEHFFVQSPPTISSRAPPSVA